MRHRAAVVAGVLAVVGLGGCDAAPQADPAASPSATATPKCAFVGGDTQGGEGAGSDCGPHSDPLETNPLFAGPVTIPDAVSGGTVTVLSAAGPRTLDPAAASTPSVSSVLSGLLVRSLVQYRYDPVTHQMVLVPDLATDLGLPNVDFTRWRYVVRDGVRWQDGEPVTAVEVARGVEHTFATGRLPVRLVKDTVRGSTLTLSFARPFPDLPYALTSPATGPARAGAGASPTPLSTGPYQVAAFEPGVSLSLVRNPQWDADTDAGRTAYPDGYRFELGVSARHPDGGDATITDGTVAAPAGDEVVPGLHDCTSYWAPDLGRTDLAVRRALAYAYPYESVARASHGALSAGGSSNLIPSGFPGRVEHGLGRDGERGTDVARARRLLVRAGETGIVVRWRHDRADPVQRHEARIVARSLTRAGFDAEPVTSGPTDVVTGELCAPWPSGGAVLPALLGPRGPAALDAPRVRRRLVHIETLPIEGQPAAWDALDHDVARRILPYVVTGYGAVTLAHGSAVQGLDVDGVLGAPTWKDLWVAP